MARLAVARIASALLALAVVLGLIGAAAAREEFRAYDIALTVAPDGTLVVTETIAANVEGIDIRHGLFRDIGKTVVGDNGSIGAVTVDILAVERDGAPELWRVENKETHVRVWMGHPDVLLEHGMHTFVLRYRVRGLALEDPRGGNAIAWEPISPGWIFPIMAASVRVELPAGARITDLAARAGPATGDRAGTWTREGNSTAMFRALLLPDARRGLAIVVRFEGGVVQAGRPGRSS